MININHLVQLKAFARQDALLLALLWAASFACIMLLKPKDMMRNCVRDIYKPFSTEEINRKVAEMQLPSLFCLMSFWL